MKTIYKLFVGLFMMTAILVSITACSSSKEVYSDITDNNDFKIEKSGAQLWGETCIKCHLVPSPASYNDVDWSTIELHMRIRANIVDADSKKIFNFLRSAN